MLVMATSRIVAVLQDYRQVFSPCASSVRQVPRLAVCLDMARVCARSTASTASSSPGPTDVEPAVAVRDGRVFWVGHVPVLLDMAHGPRHAAEIRANVLTHGCVRGNGQAGSDSWAQSTSAEMGPQAHELYTTCRVGGSDMNGRTQIVQWDIASALTRRATALLGTAHAQGQTLW